MNETIAAIATALSPSGLGIVRISGEEAVQIADRIFHKENGIKLEEVPSHTVHYGHITELKPDGEVNVIDEVMAVIMRAPHSFTKEDTVEFDCHGGVYVCKRVLDLCLKCGARLAEPGEFTKRAFLNGRIDLSEAEAVMDLISSTNENARKNSISHLSGRLKDKIVSIRSSILYEIAYIESAIDDPEHYDTEDFHNRLTNVVQSCEESLKELSDSFENGRILTRGVQTAIIGKPNVGKSSFLNLLLGEDRAIVTHIPGTTRDTLEEDVSLNGISLHLIDTAGIHDTEDVVEQIGVRKSKETIEKAELIIFLMDSSEGIKEEDRKLLPLLKNKKTIVLLNKTDLSKHLITEKDVESLFDDFTSPVKIFPFSAKTAEGLEELTNQIKELFYHGELKPDEEIYLTSLRQKGLVDDALTAIEKVKESLMMDMPEDFYSIDLMQAYASLGAIIGEEVDDDLVDEIFSKFCMGK